jgi:iron complex outermembrane recepter protein
MKLKPALVFTAAFAVALHGQQTTTQPLTPLTDDEKVIRLDDLVVTDRQDSAYKGATSITGTKTDTPLIQVPQSIQVITKDLIEDVGAVDITDLYPLMGSITEFSYGGVSARGFRQEQTRYNGIAGSPQNEFGILTLNNVQQVEVLKGPVGLLYGDNEPGGMINIVTAKPQAKFGGSLAGRVGSYGLMGTDMMVTGPIDAAGKFLYLGSLTYNERESFRDNFHSENLNLNAALTWVITPASRLTADVEFIDNKARGARLRGVPFGPNGYYAPISFNAAEASDLQDLETTVYNLRLDHVFSSNLRMNAYVRYFESSAPQAYHEPNTFNTTTLMWPREFRHQLRDMEEGSAAVNFVGDYEFLGAKHKILAGAEHYSRNRVFRTLTVNQSLVDPISVVNPVYGQSRGSDYNISLDNVVPNDTTSVRTGYYIQDQINFREKVHVLAGARYELFDDKRISPTFDQFDDAVFTYRGGVVYMLQPNIAAFVSYGMGLKPQSLGSEDRNGPFPPQESFSWEGGFKFEFFENRLGLTTTVYDITKTNVLERDPRPGVPTNWLTPIGEVNSRGFEADINGQITRDWSISANYAYNDAKVSRAGQFGDAIGSRFPNAPRHKGGLFSRYNMPRYNLGFGLGVSYVGDRPNFSGATNFPGPEYTVYNGTIFYKWRRTQFSLKCENIFDKIYSKSVFTTDGHFPGTPRSFTLSAIHRF